MSGKMPENLPSANSDSDFTMVQHSTGKLEENPTRDLATHPDSQTSEQVMQATDERPPQSASEQDHVEAEPEEPLSDLGWKDNGRKHIPAPLVRRLPNDDLWLLVRRWNKQMYHVKAFPEGPMNELDLNVADEEEFSPDKLRANLERLYLTIIIGLAGFTKHLLRLRSWQERRTTFFCMAYFIAWLLDWLMPLFFSVLLTLVLYPPSRPLLFPPIPLAMVSREQQQSENPSADSLTGASQERKGEAAEDEASNFVANVAAIGLASAAGKGKGPTGNETADNEGAINKKEHEDGQMAQTTTDAALPDPSTIATTALDAKRIGKDKTVAKEDKTKAPMEEAMWKGVRPFMRGLTDVADTWERFANALSPTPPFSTFPLIKLAGLIAPALLGSLVVSTYAFVKGTTLILGFAFFGDPIISPVLKWLNEKHPRWQRYLELRNTVLCQVPTNAQLTITLLRIGERTKAPIPPPPSSSELSLRQDTEEEKEEHEEVALSQSPEGETTEISKAPKQGQKVTAVLRTAAKATVATVLGADRLKANTVGTEASRQRLGVIPNTQQMKKLDGPSVFRGRLHGKKGQLVIVTSAATPSVAFDWDGLRKTPKPEFAVALEDIRELKKLGGLGWKGKLVVGWLGQPVIDGLEITNSEGRSWKITAMPMRDECWNRLIAMGSQRWEAW